MISAQPIHLGFVITYSEDRPITGRWRGVRYGVSASAGTYDSLIQVINQYTACRTKTLETLRHMK